MKEPNNSPWATGSFYLVVFGGIVALLAWIANQVPWYVLPMIVIGGLLAVGIIGALQLRNDKLLNEKNFVTLMGETYKRLPLLRGRS